MPQMPTCSNAHWSQSAHSSKCPFVPVLTCSQCPFNPSTYLPQMPICSGTYFSWCPFTPKCPFALNTHLLQSSSVSKCPFAPKCPLPQMPNCPSPHMLICPKHPFAPIVQCPFALVLIFPGGHFPQCPRIAPMSIGPKVPICLINAHLLWCSFFLVSIYPKCPFAPKCPFPQMSICPSPHMLSTPIFPKYPFSPKCPFAYLPWCSFFLVPIFHKYAFAPNAYLPQSSSVPKSPFAQKGFAPKVPISPNIHLSQFPHDHLS